MRVRGRMMSGSLCRPIRPACLPLAAIGVALLSFAAPTRAQTYGYSYMHMEINGHPVTNFVDNAKYDGWLQIEHVTALTTASNARQSDKSAADNKVPKTKKADAPWVKLSMILHSGRAGTGKISFGAGDSGGLVPLLEALKHKSLLVSADIDLYEEDGGAFIGKYRLKGIRVLSIEDVPASACAMDQITMSFRSAEKIQPPQ